jgi:hypothetical protein
MKHPGDGNVAQAESEKSLFRKAAEKRNFSSPRSSK